MRCHNIVREHDFFDHSAVGQNLVVLAKILQQHVVEFQLVVDAIGFVLQTQARCPNLDVDFVVTRREEGRRLEMAAVQP